MVIIILVYQFKKNHYLSIFSCWEIAKLVELGRIAFECAIDEWMENALTYQGIQLIDLTPQIVIESTRLPGNFHKDPADQITVLVIESETDCLIPTPSGYSL